MIDLIYSLSTDNFVYILIICTEQLSALHDLVFLPDDQIWSSLPFNGHFLVLCLAKEAQDVMLKIFFRN